MFLSNQTDAGQFIAENATQNEDHHEDIKLLSYIFTRLSISFFFFNFMSYFSFVSFLH